MTRIRTIKPEFWEDEKVGKLPIPCRLLFIGCWNFADDYGLVKGNPSLLKSQIFPYDDSLRVSEIKKWIEALVNARMLIPIIQEEESYYLIRTFRSHQIIDKRYDKKYVENEKELIISTLKDNVVNTSLTHSEHIVNTTEEKEKEKERKETSTNVDVKKPTRYEKFKSWMKYNTPYCSDPRNFTKSTITEKEFDSIIEKYTVEQITTTLSRIENRKDLRKKYADLYRTLLNWLRKDYGPNDTN